MQDVAPPAPNPALEPGESPPKKCQIKEEVKVWPKETYGVIYQPTPDDDPDDGAPLMGHCHIICSIFLNFVDDNSTTKV